jgi:prepilin-type processing-associated H-X9-DG protein
MNGYVGNSGTSWSAGFRVFPRYSDFTSLPPQEAFVLIDEREDSINDGTLYVDMNGYKSAAATIIVDYPADWHNRGANLSFADGHAEYWRWQDPRTMPPHRPGVPLNLNVASPNNQDVLRLIRHASAPQ